MDIKQKLKGIAREFDLKYEPKNKFKSLVLTKREIVIRVFLCGCPDPIMIKHGNKVKSQRGKNLVKYLNTRDYKREVSKPQGCVISKEELKTELSLILDIPDKKLRKETEKIYSKIKRKMGKSDRLTLISKPSKNEEKSEQRQEIILHEFIHELLEDNGIRPKSWKWNEGLVTYITNRAVGKLYRFKEEPKLKQHPMWDIYATYTRKWIKLLEKINSSKERRQTILRKIREIEKK